jgi:RNA-directed DNA polymerase
VQGALREILGVVYEPLFRECAYGFRPGRSAHDAVRQVHGLLYRGEVNWVLEGDVSSFLDAPSHCPPV